MIIKNIIANLSQIYFNLKLNFKKFYQNSNFYDKKISITKDITFPPDWDQWNMKRKNMYKQRQRDKQRKAWGGAPGSLG